MLSMIAAMTPQRVIGLNGDMPWHLPADLAWFKRNTLGKPVIMGRKTWQSIGSKPLPKRPNIVISRDTRSVGGADVVASPAAALELVTAADEVMIIGGAQIYTQFLPQAERLYITLIDAGVEGDSWFPAYEQLDWQQSFCERRLADAENPHDCTFMILDRLT